MSFPNKRLFLSLGQKWAAGILIFCAVVFLTYPMPVQETVATAAVPNEQPPADISQLSKANFTKTEKQERLAGTPSIWPANGRVTSAFGWRNSPLADGNELHAGIDIAVNYGIPVVAAADGTITESGSAGGYGNLVQIDHGNGISTLYGHNSKLAVNVGQTVKKGQIVSYAGSSGKSTGPHVHYEVRENGKPVDPWKYLVSNKLGAKRQ